MTDTVILLTIATVGLGVYVTYLHGVLRRYRVWASQATALLMSAAVQLHGEEFISELEKDEEKYS